MFPWATRVWRRAQPSDGSADPVTRTACPEDVADTGRYTQLVIAGIPAVSNWFGRIDRSESLVAFVRRLRTVAPGDHAIGDPLSLSGSPAAAVVGRFADLSQIRGHTVSREIGLGAVQVWEAARRTVSWGDNPTAGDEVTIVFTDLVGFSSWSVQAGDEATLELLRQVAVAVEPPFLAESGRVIKRLGDGVMAIFPNPESAVRAVYRARTAMAEVEVAGHRPRMRVGIHTGAPLPIGSDWLGVDVTVAARVMECGGDGNVMITQASLNQLDPTILAELGVVDETYRRGLLEPRLEGIPADVVIRRLVTYRGGTRPRPWSNVRRSNDPGRANDPSRTAETGRSSRDPRARSPAADARHARPAAGSGFSSPTTATAAIPARGRGPGRRTRAATDRSTAWRR